MSIEDMTPGQRRLVHLRAADRHLRLARDHLRYAKAPRTLARVRLSITSMGGAMRHALNRYDHEAGR